MNYEDELENVFGSVPPISNIGTEWKDKSRTCAACEKETDPIWDHDDVDEDSEEYWFYDHDASLCSGCESYFCGECSEENEGENTSRVWRCTGCARNY